MHTHEDLLSVLAFGAGHTYGLPPTQTVPFAYSFCFGYAVSPTARVRGGAISGLTMQFGIGKKQLPKNIKDSVAQLRGSIQVRTSGTGE